MYLINFHIFSDPGKIYISGELYIGDFLGALGMSDTGEVGIIENMIVAVMRNNGARGGVMAANYFPNNQTPLGVYFLSRLNLHVPT